MPENNLRNTTQTERISSPNVTQLSLTEKIKAYRWLASLVQNTVVEEAGRLSGEYFCQNRCQVLHDVLALSEDSLRAYEGPEDVTVFSRFKDDHVTTINDPEDIVTNITTPQRHETQALSKLKKRRWWSSIKSKVGKTTWKLLHKDRYKQQATTASTFPEKVGSEWKLGLIAAAPCGPWMPGFHHECVMSASNRDTHDLRILSAELPSPSDRSTASQDANEAGLSMLVCSHWAWLFKTMTVDELTNEGSGARDYHLLYVQRAVQRLCSAGGSEPSAAAWSLLEWVADQLQGAAAPPGPRGLATQPVPGGPHERGLVQELAGAALEWMRGAVQRCCEVGGLSGLPPLRRSRLARAHAALLRALQDAPQLSSAEDPPSLQSVVQAACEARYSVAHSTPITATDPGQGERGRRAPRVGDLVRASVQVQRDIAEARRLHARAQQEAPREPHQAEAAPVCVVCALTAACSRGLFADVDRLLSLHCAGALPALAAGEARGSTAEGSAPQPESQPQLLQLYTGTHDAHAALSALVHDHDSAPAPCRLCEESAGALLPLMAGIEAKFTVMLEQWCRELRNGLLLTSQRLLDFGASNVDCDAAREEAGAEQSLEEEEPGAEEGGGGAAPGVRQLYAEFHRVVMEHKKSVGRSAKVGKMVERVLCKAALEHARALERICAAEVLTLAPPPLAPRPQAAPQALPAGPRDPPGAGPSRRLCRALTELCEMRALHSKLVQHFLHQCVIQMAAGSPAHPPQAHSGAAYQCKRVNTVYSELDMPGHEPGSAGPAGGCKDAASSLGERFNLCKGELEHKYAAAVAELCAHLTRGLTPSLRALVLAPPPPADLPTPPDKPVGVGGGGEGSGEAGAAAVAGRLGRQMARMRAMGTEARVLRRVARKLWSAAGASLHGVLTDGRGERENSHSLEGLTPFIRRVDATWQVLSEEVPKLVSPPLDAREMPFEAKRLSNMLAFFLRPQTGSPMLSYDSV